MAMFYSSSIKTSLLCGNSVVITGTFSIRADKTIAVDDPLQGEAVINSCQMVDYSNGILSFAGVRRGHKDVEQFTVDLNKIRKSDVIKLSKALNQLPKYQPPNTYPSLSRSSSRSASRRESAAQYGGKDSGAGSGSHSLLLSGGGDKPSLVTPQQMTPYSLDIVLKRMSVRRNIQIRSDKKRVSDAQIASVQNNIICLVKDSSSLPSATTLASMYTFELENRYATLRNYSTPLSAWPSSDPCSVIPILTTLRSKLPAQNEKSPQDALHEKLDRLMEERKKQYSKALAKAAKSAKTAASLSTSSLPSQTASYSNLEPFMGNDYYGVPIARQVILHGSLHGNDTIASEALMPPAPALDKSEAPSESASNQMIPFMGFGSFDDAHIMEEEDETVQILDQTIDCAAAPPAASPAVQSSLRQRMNASTSNTAASSERLSDKPSERPAEKPSALPGPLVEDSDYEFELVP